jgi:predicted permease
MLLLTTALALPPLVRSALVLQAATPTAVSVLLLAEAGSADASGQQAAALVLWSTVAALVTVPLWARLLTA